ncbi:MAG: LacI family DNA-binding transcriptional regulator [Microbacteriaceae bacterium]
MQNNETWPNGRLRPTGMKAVAERAGVAISSVSRVLSGHPDVSETMRNRVIDAVAALGYEPDMLAQSLRTGESRTIGFVVSDISNPMFALMAHGAEIELRARGYSVLVANSLNNDELALQQIRHMHQRRVDGLLVSAGEERDGPISELISRSSVPTTLIDRRLDAPNASHVQSSHKVGMTAAAEHLISLGHRRIALINGLPDVLPAKLRAKALRRVAATHPEVSVSVHQGTFSEEHGESSVDALFAEAEPPTAIIAGSNQILVGVLTGLERLSLRMPDDVSLITCDSLPLAKFLSPKLAVIWRDAQLLGMRAAQVMLEHLETGEPQEVRLPTEYRPAASTGAPRLHSLTGSGSQME